MKFSIKHLLLVIAVLCCVLAAYRHGYVTGRQAVYTEGYDWCAPMIAGQLEENKCYLQELVSLRRESDEVHESMCQDVQILQGQVIDLQQRTPHLPAAQTSKLTPKKREALKRSEDRDFAGWCEPATFPPEPDDGDWSRMYVECPLPVREIKPGP